MRKKSNPQYYALKQELIKIDSQIEQVRSSYQSASDKILMNQVSHLPSIGSGAGGMGALFGAVINPLMNQTNLDSQRDAALNPLCKRREEITRLLEITPPEIEEPVYDYRHHESPTHSEQKKDHLGVFIVLRNVNVRYDPSTKSEILGTLTKDFCVKVYEKKNGWAKVGENKWIAEKYLLEIPE